MFYFVLYLLAMINVGELGNNNYFKREKASRTLAFLNDNFDIRPIIREGIKNTDPEISRRCLTILEDYATIVFPKLTGLGGDVEWDIQYFGVKRNTEEFTNLLAEFKHMKPELLDSEYLNFNDTNALSSYYLSGLIKSGKKTKQEVSEMIENACRTIQSNSLQGYDKMPNGDGGIENWAQVIKFLRKK